MCPQKRIPRAKVPLKCNFANKSSFFEDFFLKQHHALFQSWAEHCCDRQPSCLIIINIQCMGFKDDKTEENTFEILQHSDININNS